MPRLYCGHWPFNQGELTGSREIFLDLLLDAAVPSHSSSLTKGDYLTLTSVGGYPEVLRRALLHYRDRQLAEIDAVVETADGRIGGIEVKPGADIGRQDIRHLATLRDRLGDRFIAGVVLNSGPTTLPLTSRLPTR